VRDNHEHKVLFKYTMKFLWLPSHNNTWTHQNHKKQQENDLGIQLLPQVFFIQIMVLSKKQEPMSFFFDKKLENIGKNKSFLV
jgi:hypothetical protein